MHAIIFINYRHGFKTSSNLQLQVARFLEASSDYQHQVLVMFQEVENALGDVDAYVKEYDHSLSLAQWTQKSNQLYIDRYKLGVINYIDVVNTERDLLNYQINLNTLKGYRYIATVQLIKSLGGGWGGN